MANDVPVQKQREILVQMLYSKDLGEPSDAEMIEFLQGEFDVSEDLIRELQKKMRKVLALQQELDAKIADVSKTYELERIPFVERNILRLGIYELLYDQEVPEKVAIAEAVRLARKFASPEAGTFVNGLLDTIYRAKGGDEPSADQQLSDGSPSR